MNDFTEAKAVSAFMQRLDKVDKKRYYEALGDEIPFGDISYGEALTNWKKKGSPSNAWFSYHPSQVACPLLTAFRKEISEKFGLEILTAEEADLRRQQNKNVETKKVYDHHLN